MKKKVHNSYQDNTQYLISQINKGTKYQEYMHVHKNIKFISLEKTTSSQEIIFLICIDKIKLLP